jgi:hypothetical protein
METYMGMIDAMGQHSSHGGLLIGTVRVIALTVHAHNLYSAGTAFDRSSSYIRTIELHCRLQSSNKQDQSDVSHILAQSEAFLSFCFACPHLVRQ